MGNFKEEMLRVRETRFGAVPRVWQVGRSLLASYSDSANVASLRGLVLEWAAEKWRGLIPKTAWDGQPFEVIQAGLNIAAVNLPEQEIWSFRSEHIGREESRSWVTEVLVATIDKRRVLGIRNLCSSLGGDPPPRSMPRFAREAVDRFDFRDADWRLRCTPFVLESEDDGDRLVDFLCSQARNLPVNVVTKDRDADRFITSLKGNTENLTVRDQVLIRNEGYFIDGYRLAWDTTSVAHTVLASETVTRVLTKVLGSHWSVFNGAVRTYYPGYDPSVDDLYRHPLTLAARIDAFEDNELKGSQAFQTFLVRVLHERSCAPSNERTEFPDFFAAKSRQLAVRAQTAESAELVPILEEQLQLSETERTRWEDYAGELATNLDIANARVFQLQAQNEALLAALERQRAGKMPEELDPTTYEEIAPWVERVFLGKLKLHSRAVRSLKNAAYEDPRLVIDGLKMLANEYRDMRIAAPNDADARRQALEDRLKALGLERTGAITREQAGAFDDEYFVDYPIGQRSRQRFEEHLTKGNSREERHCLRIYYFWDPEQKQVVVGSLPGHLRNRLT
jgi:hypothetical protein